MGPKYTGSVTLTFHGHATSSVTWSFDSQVQSDSYWCSIATKSVYPAIVENMGSKLSRSHDLDLSGWYGVNGHEAIRFAVRHFLLVLFWNRASVSIGFRDIRPDLERSQTQCWIIIAHARYHV